MEAINTWVRCILATIILVGLVEIIVPDGEIRKFVFLLTGIITSIVIATPIIKVISGEYSMQDVFNVDMIEDNFFYIDTFRGTVNRQAEVLEEIFADNVVARFNELYKDMEISDCKIVFLHDHEGKITEIKEVIVTSAKNIENIELLKRRISDICEVSLEKVRVS